MRIIGVLFLVTILSSCSSNMSLKEVYSFDIVKQLATQQWEEHKGTEEYERFKNDWLSFNNANGIDERGSCYALGGSTEVIILVQNINGTIQDVVLENKNKKTNCFKETFLGEKYPAPPFSPFYHYMIMQGELAH